MVSNVALVSPPLTRLPSVTSLRPMRPSIGDTTRRKLDVELGAFECAFRRDDGSLRGLHGLSALVDHLLRYRLGAPEFDRALEIAAREGELRLRRLQPPLFLLGHRLVGPRIDDEEKVSLLDHGAFLEVRRLQIAAHPRTDADVIDRLKTSGELIPLGDHLAHRLAHAHRWRRRLVLPGGIVLSASAEGRG